MKSTQVFSNKAEKYARYRWHYAPEAVEDFCRSAGLGPKSQVADLGAGTGILTAQLAEKVGHLYAVEPNLEMRCQAEKTLAGLANCTLLETRAEDTGLPAHSLDAVVIAEAAHWFDPIPARAEILRILKPGGWLGLFHNTSTDTERNQAVAVLHDPQYGVELPAFSQPGVPWEFFFNGAASERRLFPFTLPQNWEGFLGALLSTSYMPDEDHPLYPLFEAACRQVFERFSVDGHMEVHGRTEVLLGVPQPD